MQSKKQDQSSYRIDFWRLNIMNGIKVGGVGEIVAFVAGGKHGARCRMATFVARRSAGRMRSATVLADMRRVDGSNLPLWRKWQMSP